MKPFEGNPENGSKERIFNYRLSRARRDVENAFGILSAIFRVFRKPILLEPNKATKVVLAAVYLYNYIRKNTSTNLISPELFDRELDGALIPGQWRNEINEVTFAPIAAFPRRSSNNAKEIRLHLAEHFSCFSPKFI